MPRASQRHKQEYGLDSDDHGNPSFVIDVSVVVGSGSVKVTLHDPYGRPLEGVTVTAQSGDTGVVTINSPLVTDANGAATFTATAVATGTTKIYFIAEGQGPLTPLGVNIP
jgi:hypothetical protein